MGLVGWYKYIPYYIISQVYKVQARNTRFYCTWAFLIIIDKPEKSPQGTSYMDLIRVISSYSHAIDTPHQSLFTHNRLKQSCVLTYTSRSHATASVARRQYAVAETLINRFQTKVRVLLRLLYTLITSVRIKTLKHA